VRQTFFRDRGVRPVVDHIERAAIAAEGYDPDAPAVVAALARVGAVTST
jgi:hypothetical protein